MKRKNMFQPVRPLSVPVKFVNYEPPLKSEVNKAESEESKKSVLNSEKSKTSHCQECNKDLQSERKEHRTYF